MFFTWFQGCVDYNLWLCFWKDSYVFIEFFSVICMYMYKVKVHVTDATDEVVFVLFDNRCYVLVSAAKV